MLTAVVIFNFAKLQQHLEKVQSTAVKINKFMYVCKCNSPAYIHATAKKT